MKNNNRNFQIYYWSDVRERIAAQFPALAAAIDEINPAKDFYFYGFNYAYGDCMIHHGLFQLPLANGRLVSITDPCVPKQIQQDLAYYKTAMPAAIVTKNSAELCLNINIKHQQDQLPWTLYSPGSPIALWAKLDKPASYHPTKAFSRYAGARHLMMAAEISNSTKHQRLCQQLKAHHPVPRSLKDHHKIFTAITHSAAADCDWHNEIIAFSGPFINNILQKNGIWQRAKQVLLELAWHHTAYWRNRIFYNTDFSYIQRQYNLRVEPFVIDTAKRILGIVAGSGACFTIATDETAGPIKLIQQHYDAYYKINYLPLVLQPTCFSMTSQRTYYYSLQVPTAAEYSPSYKRES